MAGAIASTEGNLLFGLLALQNGLIDQDQLLAAFRAWSRDKLRPLAEHLVARGDLDADDRDAVGALVVRHLKKHRGDAGQSLAAIRVGGSTRERLARLGDAQVDATLARVGSVADPSAQRDADHTASYSVGSATSDGQRFRILRPHAQGGLGAVFVALDSELKREVALKQILDSHADDPVNRARFVVEAEITGGLEHPGIVPVYGLGSHGDGRPFYAMRFVRGESLKQAIDSFHGDPTHGKDSGRRTFELRKLLRRFADVCNAVEYAHSRGVIHRDIKPSNVIVGKHGETLLVDWGLAKATGKSDPASDERTLRPGSSSGSSETLPGSALGTPAYMSPEQAAGDIEHVGPASDVYSLGATLYCLLTGKPPFAGDAPDILRAVRKSDFRRPRAVASNIDRALESVCLKAMAAKPADRYATPKAMAEDIERWMADLPVTAWDEPLARRARRWGRRNRTAVAMAVAAVLVALAGLAAVLAVKTRANLELTAANVDLATANSRVTRANTELLAANQRERERFDLAMDAIKLFHGEISEDLLLKERLFAALRTKLLRGAADFYARLESLLTGQTDAKSRAALSRAYEELGVLTATIGNKPDALALHRKALAVRRELAAGPDADARAKLDVAQSLLATASLQAQTGEKGAAMKTFQEVHALAEAMQETGDLAGEVLSILGTSQHEMGRAFFDIGERDLALAAHQRARAIRQKLADHAPDAAEHQRDLARSHHSIGILLQNLGKPPEALASYEESRAILEKLARFDPSAAQLELDLAANYFSIGELLGQIGRNPAEALAAYDRARVIQERLAAANPSVTRLQFALARTYNGIGLLTSSTGDPARALAACARARDIFQKLTDNDPSVTDWQFHLAWAHLSIGFLQRTSQPGEALASLELARAILEKLTAENPAVIEYQTFLANAVLGIGGLKQAQGRPAHAAEAYQSAIAILEKLPVFAPGDYYSVACAHARLAGVAALPASKLPGTLALTEADQAMVWLKRAVGAGYRMLAMMRADTDLGPLRSRQDFQSLMMDLAMPDWPIASER